MINWQVFGQLIATGTNIMLAGPAVIVISFKER
jgi:hypothetical protein